MSRKRTAAESISNELTNAESDPTSQQENNAKRAKLTPLSDTTLQDLPIELLQCILVKAVAMEVKGLKLAKRVWKEKADLVIDKSRLRTVCSQWNSILTTNSFRAELYRNLDGTAEETIRLEIVSEFRIKPGSSRVTTMKDEIFLLLVEERVINVYNRDRISNRVTAKDVIQLPKAEPAYLEACSVSNCVYVALRTNDYYDLSVLRITKEEEHQFNITPWLKDRRLSISMMSATASGSLIILSVQNHQGPNVISIYDANGSLQHEMMLSPDIDVQVYVNVMQKSNGNILLAYVNDQDFQANLLEFDMSGSEVRRYQSSFSEACSVYFADSHGRVLISEPFKGFELLDPEFNSLGIYSLQQDNGKDIPVHDLHYESERNEIVRIHYDWNTDAKVLTIFRVTED